MSEKAKPDAISSSEAPAPSQSRPVTNASPPVVAEQTEPVRISEVATPSNAEPGTATPSITATAATATKPGKAQATEPAAAPAPFVPQLTPTPEPPDGQVGRPRVLTASGDPKNPGPMELYVAALSVGMTRKDAALNALVGYNTVRRALIQGRKDNRRGLNTQFREFWVATRQAEVRAKFVLASRVYVASADPANWRAAIAMLERRHPKEYGLTLTQRLQGDEDRPIVFKMKLRAGPAAPGLNPRPGDND